MANFSYFEFFRYFDLENDQLPTNRFLLFFTNLMYAKSSVHCCKIGKIGSPVFEKIGAKYGRKWNIQTPISPLNGGRFPPFKNHFCQGPQGYNAHESDRGSGPHLGEIWGFENFTFSHIWPQFSRQPVTQFSQFGSSVQNFLRTSDVWKMTKID